MSGELQLGPERRELYQAQLDAILSTPLTPDNIQTYADDALEQLIGLAQTTVEAYQREVAPPAHATRYEMEDAALHHFGLQNIETILDHVSEVADGIHSLDAVIARAEKVSYVITPPDSDAAPEFSPGAGTFEKDKRTELRLKTALFVLQQDFELDVSDPRGLALFFGAIPSGMMRGASYYQLIAPSLERMLLVCDAPGNATYVLDTSAFAELGISSDQITRMAKEELNELLRSQQQLGQRIVYQHGSFAAQLREAVQEPARQVPTGRDGTLLPSAVSYLHRVAPEGALSLSMFAQELGLDRHTVSQLHGRLLAQGAVGPMLKYRFIASSGRGGIGLAAEDQEAIRRLAEVEGMLTKMPDDAVTIEALAQRLNRAIGTIDRIIGDLVLRGEVEAVPVYGPRKVRGLTPAHQEAVARVDQIERSPDAPDDVISIVAFAKQSGMSYEAVKTALDRLVARGEVEAPQKYQYRVNGKQVGAAGIGLTPGHQDAVLREATERGIFALRAPDTVLSPEGLAKLLRSTGETVLNVYTALIGEERIAEAERFRFGPVTAVGLTLAMQREIAIRLRDTIRTRPTREAAARFLEELDKRSQ